MPSLLRPVLPTELFEEIMGHAALSTHSTTTLRACSQVNSTMYYLSQKLLFREVTITYTLETASHPDSAFITPTTISIFDRADGPATGLKFYDFLQRSRHIQPYVRTLKLQFLEGGRTISPHRHIFSLQSILSLLRKLETLVFCRLWGIGSDTYQEIEFNPMTIRNFRKSLLSLPYSVRHLDTRGFAMFPLSLVLQCPVGLQKLSFTRLDDALPVGPFYQRLKLVSLDMGTCSPLSQAGIDVSLLEHLRISTQPEFPFLEAQVRSIVDGCKDTLEHLEISAEWLKRRIPDGVQAFTQQLDGLAGSLQLRSHVALRRVTFSVIFSWLNAEAGTDEEDLRVWESFVAVIRALLLDTPQVTSVTLSVQIHLIGIEGESGILRSLVFPGISDLAMLTTHYAFGKNIKVVLQELRHYRTPHESLISMNKFWTRMFVPLDQ